MPITVGVDIGGSHISSAAIDMENNAIIKGSYFHGFVNNKANKESILVAWSRVINETLSEVDINEVNGLSFAMPGPFNYKGGIAMFERNDKYEALYNVPIASELSKFIVSDNLEMRFLNDASSFAVGGSLNAKHSKIVAITLGTGFGAAFLKDNVPVFSAENIAADGRLWDKPFLNGIADDYFSTRWFISRFKELTGANVKGVKEITELHNKITNQIFQEFSQNLSEFLLPFLTSFEADLVQLGGSIAKAHHLFLPNLLRNWKISDYEVPVNVIDNTESANIIGSSFLFDEKFWNNVKNNLPVD